MAKAVNKKVTKKVLKQQEGSTAVARTVALSLVMVCVLAVLYWQVQSWFMNPATLPIKIVRIDGELKYLQKAELENSVADVVSGGFFNIDLKAIMNRAHQLPWVDEVSVKRIWPDTVVMNIREQVAVARWGEKRLVTAKGETFLPSGLIPEGLAVLQGNNERALEVVELYEKEKMRFAKLDLTIVRLGVNNRGAWSVAFENGLEIAIGRIDVEQRLQRLADNFPAIIQRGRPEYIDLRYRHGISVSWKQNAQQLEHKNIKKEAV
jgi:cell division protein FtsQ